MRCKKHQADYSSTVGVCATCLRERLLAIVAAQTQKQAQLHQSQQDYWKSDTKQPFPRSVSPYISHRKSHTAVAATWDRFFSTPQLGPKGTINLEIKNNSAKKSNRRNFSSMFLGLFRSKSVKPDLDSDPGSDPPILVDSCTASPSWYSTIVPGRKKRQIQTFSLDESIAIGPGRKTYPIRDRGMSPVRYFDEEKEEQCHCELSGYSSESSQGWMQTPRRTPALCQRSGARTAAAHSRSVSGLAFCLSPLVRARPNWHLGQKYIPPEAMMTGESRVLSKPRLSDAASFCKNRSRKLTDFGRYNYNPNY